MTDFSLIWHVLDLFWTLFHHKDTHLKLLTFSSHDAHSQSIPLQGMSPSRGMSQPPPEDNALGRFPNTGTPSLNAPILSNKDVRHQVRSRTVVRSPEPTQGTLLQRETPQDQGHSTRGRSPGSRVGQKLPVHFWLLSQT